MFCKFCGKELNEDAKFCPGCGAQLGEKKSVNVEKKVEKAPVKKSSKKPVLAAVLAFVVIAAVAAVGVGKFMGSKGGSGRAPKYVWTCLEADDYMLVAAYDDDGNVVSELYGSKSDENIEETVIDEDFLLIKEITYDLDWNVTSEIKVKNEKEYDDDGNLVKATQYIDGEVIRIIERTYDENNEVLEKQYVPGGDEGIYLFSEAKWTADRERIESKYYDQDGEQIDQQKCEYAYNEKGVLEEGYVYDVDTNKATDHYIYHNEKLSDYLKNKDEIEEELKDMLVEYVKEEE